MIDLHNHILPAMDDGAADLGESLAIARQFASEGVHTVVATPHYDASRGTGPPAEDVRRLVDRVQDAVSGSGVDLTVRPGHELYLTPDAPRLLATGVVTGLAGGPYVLVEVSLSMPERPLYLDDTLFRLQVAGYRPILAHPERYPFVQRDPSAIGSLARRGIALQLTAPAFLGEYGRRVRRTAETLLKLGLYTLAASDRHHPGPTRSLAALDAALRRGGASDQASLLLSDNPARVLDGHDLLPVASLDERGDGVLARWFRRPTPLEE